MSSSAEFIAITTNIILLIWLGLLIPGFNKSRGLSRVILSILIAIFVVWVPVYNNFSLVRICRGELGDLSLTSLIVLTHFQLQKIYPCGDLKTVPLSFAWLLGIAGLLLYLSTLGIIPVDLYSWGYFPRLLLGLFILAELVLWWSSKLNAWFWLIALIAFLLKLQSSSNLWDYIFDPILWLISVGTILKYFWLMLSARRNNRQV
ncbi:MAG: hypothetical protein ACK4M7_06420 [Burkholderiales bacterium]